jgi:CO/xanthine dehydrogenase FAD-binding subunit
VGKSLPKRPGFDKVTGRARYAFDVQLPGMLYGAIVRSTEARGLVVAIDPDKAMKIPGVRTILTPANFPTLPSQGWPALADRVRQADEFPLDSVALAAHVHGGTCRDCRVVLGSIAPRPYRDIAVEEAMKGRPLTADNIHWAVAAALAEAKPMAMNAYKIDLTRNLVVRAFQQVA